MATLQSFLLKQDLRLLKLCIEVAADDSSRIMTVDDLDRLAGVKQKLDIMMGSFCGNPACSQIKEGKGPLCRGCYGE